MKTVTKNVCDFSEVFNFADKKFGVSWNSCNDLFFRTEVLRYQRLCHICTAGFEDSRDVHVPAGYPYQWSKDIQRDVAEKILYHFLVEKGVNQCVVDCSD
jgi:hypothetical protein